MKIKRFKQFIVENIKSEYLAYRIFIVLFYSKERNITYENSINNHFPINFGDINELNKVLNNIGKNIKLTKENVNENNILSILNKYFNSKNEKSEMFTFLSEYEPKITTNNIDNESFNLYSAFYSKFGFN